MRDDGKIDGRVAVTRAPAKLNLFLELLARRDDGYHEIDTVMVPINWCDELRIRRTEQPGVRLRLEGMPSVPVDSRNLVVRALEAMIPAFAIPGGFTCELRKSIPAGAGLGGASSDAASTIASAARLCGIPDRSPRLYEIAESIGSDVPFFLGTTDEPISAIRATGRGERLSAVPMAGQLDLVVIYPNVTLSTAKVYAASQVPAEPNASRRLLENLTNALKTGDHEAIGASLTNRLSNPARKLAPQIDEILDSVWRAGCRTCQLTGSGSAVFALVDSSEEARRLAILLQSTLEKKGWQRGGAIVRAVRTTRVPSPIVIHQST